MPQLKSNNRNMRYKVLSGAVLMQLCVGAIYTWSLFNQPLSELYGWRREDILLAYSINILTFALTTVVSGKLQDRYGPRVVASAGALALGAGVFLTGNADTLLKLYLSYGLVAGIGVGLVYPCPLATCIKWFPDRKGLVTGISIGAFGLGGLVFKDLILQLLNGYGVEQTFRYLGYLYLCAALAGAQMLRLPHNSEKKISEGMTPALGEVVRSLVFFRLWFTFLFGTISGLLLLGMAKDLGVTMGSMSPADAAHLVGIASLSNAGGRLGYGLLSDKMSRWRLVGLINLLTASCTLMLAFAPMNPGLFTAVLIVVVSGFGGLLAMYPAITAETFGTSSFGRNYGMIFAAYGIAAFLGPYVAGKYPLWHVLAACSALSATAALISFEEGRKKAAPSQRIDSRNGEYRSKVSKTV